MNFHHLFLQGKITPSIKLYDKFYDTIILSSEQFSNFQQFKSQISIFVVTNFMNQNVHSSLISNKSEIFYSFIVVHQFNASQYITMTNIAALPFWGYDKLICVHLNTQMRILTPRYIKLYSCQSAQIIIFFFRIWVCSSDSPQSNMAVG